MNFDMPPIQEKKQIKDARTMEELFSIIDSLDGVQGSQENFSSEQLKDIIQKVQNEELNTSYITRSYGLRDKVEELLNKESIKEIKDVQSLEELYKVLKYKGGLDGSYRHYSAEELIQKIENYRESRFEIILGEITRANGLRDKVEELLKK